MRGAGVIVAACLAAGCATAPVIAPTIAPAPDAAFTIDGRLSARRGSEGATANFTWRHAPPRDDIVVTTPLGQALAEISGDHAVPRYELRLADGRREDASGWAALTERALGAPIPVEGLSVWINGAPRPGAPYYGRARRGGARDRVATGRLGYRLRVRRRHDTRAGRGVQLTQADLEIRIVVLARR